MKQCSCGYVGDSRFCPQCGAPLNWQQASRVEQPAKTEVKQEDAINISPDDTGLKMVVNTFSKRILPSGESCSEEVLYLDETTGEYQVHSYSKEAGQEENHRAYTIARHDAQEIAQFPIREKMSSIPERQEGVMPASGIMLVIKYVDETGTVKRIEVNAGEGREAYSKLSGCLKAHCQMERMIVPEYAKSWKSISINSTAMSMDGCYHFLLEKTDNGEIRVKGSFFSNGQKKEATDWIILAEEQKQELSKIPLGMMYSARRKSINPMPGPMMGMSGMNGMGSMMSDGASYSCMITYGDGRSDSKLKDSSMMQKLLEVMCNVF